MIGKEIEGKNAVVIRIGENVKNMASFSANLHRLINYCKDKVGKVIITGNFWPNADIEETIINAAIQTKIKYIPMSWISALFDVYPGIGDTLYNNDYQPYTINKDFIITHPDDKGMRMIAEEIYKAF